MVNQLYTWFKERKYLILLIILLAVVYWKWWLSGPRVATDFPTVSSPDLKIQLNIPQLWFLRGSIGFGGYSVFTLWSWLMDFIAGMFANFGFTFEILERLMFIIPTLLIGIYSIWNLLKKLKLSQVGRFVAVFFYLSNTYILLLIDGGQLGIGLAYAWFPTAYLLFLNSIKSEFKYKIYSGLGMWALGILDIRFVYILAILLILRFIFFGWNLEWIKSGLVVAVIFSALNIYWIAPLIKYPLSSARFSDLTKASDLNFTQFKHSLTLLQPHWYENIFGKIPPLKKEFLLIPLIAFMAPLLRRKSKEVWFWTVIALTSVFLAKGANSPLAGIYTWLFTNIPGFSLFRDSTKFFFLVSLSYSVLIAFTVDLIIKRYSKFKVVFPLLVISYFLYLIRPVYLGTMTGTFSTPRYESQYSILSTIFENDQSFGRIFWIPSRPPLGYASPLHPSPEASRLQSLRPFAVGTVGNYETQNFIREGNYMGELFDISGIKYIAYPYFDPKRDDMSEEKIDYYNTFHDQISTLPWISGKVSDFPVPVFKTKENKGKFFLSQNTFFIVGSDRIYQEIKNLGAKFSDNALIFIEEKTGTLDLFEAKIILYDKNLTDLAISLVDKDKFISPSKNLNFSPNEMGWPAGRSLGGGWWKRQAVDVVWLRNFLQEKYGIDNLDFDYGTGWAIAEGEKKLTINNEQFTKGKVLYARVMQSSRGGEVGFYQEGNLVGNVTTKEPSKDKVEIKLKKAIYDKADFHWIRIGEVLKDFNLDIKTKGDINIVNSLVILSLEEEKELIQEVASLESEGKIVKFSGDLFKGENKAKVTYETLAPTHYKIKIEGLKSPTTLFFSDIFDNGWELNSNKGYSLYSLLNGFWVDGDGEYDLYFAPQKYVVPGLIISLTTLTSCIIFLVCSKKFS